MAELKIKADSGGGTVSFKGPATTTSNAAVQLTLPVDDGAANQYLKTDGSGVLSWATVDTSIADDSINSQHYAAASIDNEHLADDAVGVAELSATGTASATTFLRGDNSWVAPAGGISEMDHWKFTSSFTGNAAPLSSNLARNTQAGSLTKVGTGMTVSSGVWTFPSTGYWEVFMRAKTNATTKNHYARIYTEHSSDGGSNWVESSLSYGGTGGSDGGNSFFEGIIASHIHKISNTTNDVVRISCYVSNSAANWSACAAGDGGANAIFFTKLAEV